MPRRRRYVTQCLPGPIHAHAVGRGACAPSAAIGTTARQAILPVNIGFRAQHLLTHGRVNAVGTDQRIAGYLAPVGQPYLDRVFGLAVARNLATQVKRIWALRSQCRCQHFNIIGAVNLQIWRAPAFDRVLGQWNETIPAPNVPFVLRWPAAGKLSRPPYPTKAENTFIALGGIECQRQLAQFRACSSTMTSAP